MMEKPSYDVVKQVEEILQKKISYDYMNDDMNSAISGVETLRVKESDRIEALINEMRKCGYLIQCIMHNAQPMVLSLGEKCTIFVEQESRQKEVIHNSQLDGQVPRIKTYNDHRIAMSMAVVGLIREIEIENREVVNKSYPEFWREFDRVKNIYCK